MPAPAVWAIWRCRSPRRAVLMSSRPPVRTKLDFVRSLGADKVIDYTREDFAAKAGNFDLVLETVGGDHAEDSLRVLRDGGVLVSLLNVHDTTKTNAKERNIRVERMSVVPDREGLVQLAKL